MSAIITLQEMVRAAVAAGLGDTRVSMPAIVRAFHEDAPQRVDVQPCLSDTVIEEGAETTYTLPPVFDVPVQFIGGGGTVITHPVQIGDPCYLVFADRSLDSWIDSGEAGAPASLQIHHLADAVAIFGVRSRKDALQVFDNTKITLGLVEGTTYAIALAKKVMDALNALRDAFNGHTHLTAATGAASPPTVLLPSTATIPVTAFTDVASTIVQTRE